MPRDHDPTESLAALFAASLPPARDEASPRERWAWRSPAEVLEALGVQDPSAPAAEDREPEDREPEDREPEESPTQEDAVTAEALIIDPSFDDVAACAEDGERVEDDLFDDDEPTEALDLTPQTPRMRGRVRGAAELVDRSLTALHALGARSPSTWRRLRAWRHRGQGILAWALAPYVMTIVLAATAHAVQLRDPHLRVLVAAEQAREALIERTGDLGLALSCVQGDGLDAPGHRPRR